MEAEYILATWLLCYLLLYNAVECAHGYLLVLMPSTSTVAELVVAAMDFIAAFQDAIRILSLPVAKW